MAAERLSIIMVMACCPQKLHPATPPADTVSGTFRNMQRGGVDTPGLREAYFSRHEKERRDRNHNAGSNAHPYSFLTLASAPHRNETRSFQCPDSSCPESHWGTRTQVHLGPWLRAPGSSRAPFSTPFSHLTTRTQTRRRDRNHNSSSNPPGEWTPDFRFGQLMDRPSGTLTYADHPPVPASPGSNGSLHYGSAPPAP